MLINSPPSLLALMKVLMAQAVLNAAFVFVEKV